MKNAQKSIKSLSDSVKNHTSVMEKSFKSLAKVIAATFSIKILKDFIQSCLNLGSDLTEVQNVVDVTFEEMSAEADKFAQSCLETFGLSETTAKRYMGTFGAMAKSFGFSNAQALEMSETLTGLVGDVASFYNLDSAIAYTKLKAVFTGETEALKELGVVMTQTALDEFALQKGYKKTVKEMSEAEKVMLRQAFVLERLKDAQGDFARNINSWANQTRILSEGFDKLKTSLGQGFIQILTPLIQKLNELMIYLQGAADAFANFTAAVFGKQEQITTTTTANIADDMSDIAGSAEAAEAAVDRMTSSFDELHKVSSNASSDLSGLSGFEITTEKEKKEEEKEDTTVIDKMREAFERFMNSSTVVKFKDMFASIKKMVLDIGAAFKTAWEGGHGEIILNNFKLILDHIFDGVKRIADKFNEIWNKPSGHFDEFGNELTWGEYLSNKILTLIEKIQKLVDEINIKLLEAIENIDWETVFEQWGKDLDWLIEHIEKLTALISDSDTSGLSGVLTFLLAHIFEIWAALTLFKLISPWVIKIIDWISTVIRWVSKIGPAISGIAPIITDLGITIGGWAAAAGLAIIGIIGLFENLKGFIHTLGEILEADLSFQDWMDGIKTYFTNVWNNLVKMFTDGIQSIKDKINSIKSFFGFEVEATGTVKTPQLAEGGYFAPRSPRLVTIGEGNYGEVVANDRQLNDLKNSIVSEIAQIMSSTVQQPAAITNEIYIGQEKIEGLVTKTIQKNNYRNGGRR